MTSLKSKISLIAGASSGFGDFKNFYNWYIGKEGKCFYCKTKENILIKLFKNKSFKSKHPGSSTGILQIDKINPKKNYSKENCVLACIFCNNAKTDLIHGMILENI